MDELDKKMEEQWYKEMELKYALRLQAVWRGRKARIKLKWQKSIKKV